MRVFLAVIVITGASMAAACGDSAAGPSGPGGTLNLRITDAPFEDARSVLVTFSDVSVHRQEEPEGEWIRIPFADGGTSRTCDLKQLQNANEDILGVGTLAAGHYTQIRLTVASARLYFDNAAPAPACAASIAPPAGASASVDVSSGEVKIVRQFTVPEGGATTVLLDFDGGRSIHQTGNGAYRMTPVIGVLSVR